MKFTDYISNKLSINERVDFETYCRDKLDVPYEVSEKVIDAWVLYIVHVC